MRTLSWLAVLLFVSGPAFADNTTILQNGGNHAAITQSGNSADTQRMIEQTPGHTRIDQRNGGNSSTIIQDGPGAKLDAPDLDDKDD